MSDLHLAQFRPFGWDVICHVQTRFSSSLWANWHSSFRAHEPCFTMCRHIASREASLGSFRGSGLTGIHFADELSNTAAHLLRSHEWLCEQDSLLSLLNSSIPNLRHSLHRTSNRKSGDFWPDGKTWHVNWCVAITFWSLSFLQTCSIALSSNVQWQGIITDISYKKNLYLLTCNSKEG